MLDTSRRSEAPRADLADEDVLDLVRVELRRHGCTCAASVAGAGRVKAVTRVQAVHLSLPLSAANEVFLPQPPKITADSAPQHCTYCHVKVFDTLYIGM